MKNAFKDYAILLTWPDATIRGDEKWMMFFKKIGIVKNINFKVGHTGIILINHLDGTMLYYDFGRYITPRGYGRARSKDADPLLKIDIKAIIKDGEIRNIDKIITYLESIKAAFYGTGKLYFSIVRDINFNSAKKYGDDCVIQGTYPYGALARNNNNCSRFITRMLMRSSTKFHFWHSIHFPETIKSSPISNLVNAVADRTIYSYTAEEKIVRIKMTRFQSFWFLLKQLGDNVSSRKSSYLPSDAPIGAMQYQYKPSSLPDEASYLGGVGDGAWYYYEIIDKQHIRIQRFTTTGQLEYTVLGLLPAQLDVNQDFSITYDSHLLFTHVLQGQQRFLVKHLKQLDIDKSNNYRENYPSSAIPNQ